MKREARMLRPGNLVNTPTADKGSPPPLGIPAEAAGSQATGWFGPGEAGSKVKTLEILRLPGFLNPADSSPAVLQTDICAVRRQPPGGRSEAKTPAAGRPLTSRHDADVLRQTPRARAAHPTRAGRRARASGNGGVFESLRVSTAPSVSCAIPSRRFTRGDAYRLLASRNNVPFSAVRAWATPTKPEPQALLCHRLNVSLRGVVESKFFF